MTGTDNSFPATSIPSHTLSIRSSGEEWRASVSTTHGQMFSKFDKSADCTSLDNNRTPSVFTLPPRRPSGKFMSGFCSPPNFSLLPLPRTLTV
ncbi:hypothetical protein TNCV_2737651 [Trichonephila clavipes]|nr:hypothetical protein TNCV_2737651 [Trichonephila clavipes]